MKRGHPTNKDIALRIQNVADGKIRVLLHVVAARAATTCSIGRPHGTHFAFASFQMLPENEATANKQ